MNCLIVPTYHILSGSLSGFLSAQTGTILDEAYWRGLLQKICAQPVKLVWSRLGLVWSKSPKICVIQILIIFQSKNTLLLHHTSCLSLHCLHKRSELFRLLKVLGAFWSENGNKIFFFKIFYESENFTLKTITVDSNIDEYKLFSTARWAAYHYY